MKALTFHNSVLRRKQEGKSSGILDACLTFHFCRSFFPNLERLGGLMLHNFLSQQTFQTIDQFSFYKIVCYMMRDPCSYVLMRKNADDPKQWQDCFTVNPQNRKNTQSILGYKIFPYIVENNILTYFVNEIVTFTKIGTFDDFLTM